MPSDIDKAANPAHVRRNPGALREVLLAFLKLGLTSFGGPVAHLGYFRTEFVERRHWLDDKSYSDLVALCQFLPGPASSQVGMALGMARAGWLGAIVAWLGFTLPSAIALILFALGIAQWAGAATTGVIHGLKVVAVAIVAQAVWGMAKSLCPDRLRAGIALLSTLLVLAISTTIGQIAAITMGALLGKYVLRINDPPPMAEYRYGVSRKQGALLLILCGTLLLLLPTLATTSSSTLLPTVSAFYQAGALVFGGGHVVLPLLQSSIAPAGLVSNDVFLAGYGATQAVPGPLFTFAAYLGAVMPAPLGGWLGGLLLLLVIFMPAFLLVIGALPFWETLRLRNDMQQTLAGINAAVVGLLAAALYDPVWTSAIHNKVDFGFALMAFALLQVGRISPAIVVALAALCGWIVAI